MHGCTSGCVPVVNAELDSMGGVGISSTPSPQKSSDLEKTQAELRQTFATAEKFRRELEFLQKGGDPLDLKPGNAASVSFQSTSLKGHPEQLVVSEAKGSFAITASPHGDSVESSGRLGAPSACEPNSADNLMLLKESGDSAVLELPKKSYKRRIRSRSARDPIRHASRDHKGLSHDANVAQKTSINHLENKPEPAGAIDQVQLTDSKILPTNGNTEVIKNIPGPTKAFDMSSCAQVGQHFDDDNGNGLHVTKQMEQNLESNDLGAEKNDNMLNSGLICNDDGPDIKEDGLQGSESVTVVGPNPISQDGNANAGSELNTCSQENLKLATKEHEDSVLEEARIIEAKRKRIAELSVRTLRVEKRLKSHWDFVLEEMSWLANDFAQERLWKVIAAAQISRRVAIASQRRFRQQISLQKQKELSHNVAEAVMQFWHMIHMKCKGPESHAVGIQGYAMRFMEYNSSKTQCIESQTPLTFDIVSDLGIMDYSWDDNLTEENLFYTVPPSAIEAYRKAIDSHMLHFERTGTSMQEEVDTSCYDAVADNDAFEEDEGETNTYYFPGGFEGRKSTKSAQKRRMNFNLYGSRSYAAGDDVPFMQSVERTVGNQPGKRYGSSLNVTIPTKRVRTASRQRIISPYNAGTSGNIHAPNNASSADTNSFQDEHSVLHGGTQIQNNLEAESAGDYEKFDSMEVSNRPKKKKKEKHPGSAFEHRWQLDPSFQNDQKDHSRRRLDTHQFDSNGSSAVSQMSNMSNTNKFMKLLVRDRGRKVKAPKTPVRQPGSGSPWSLFEDQALVVLVHDMGPNWELISDAINSTLQFKCIFRKSMECKARHKILMDMNNGDGGDSAEDSGSSQPYQSTLPGIPEGSARQLFQRLQGPMEEDTLKTHFEKIIMIGQKQHYRNRPQNINQDTKQLPHSSHAFALSQVCPNNLNGGPVLTPLELAEAISSSPDVLPAGYQGLHSGGLPPLNHGPIAPMLPALSPVSGSTSAPAPSNVSASAPLDPSVRMQQYGQMLSARNTQQSSLPPGSHSVNDRGNRMLPGGNGMGATNRNMKMTRPLSMLSSTSTPMLRPRDPVHIRVNQNTDQKASPSGPGPGPGPSPSSTQQSYPGAISPHPHHFQGNPAYAMRLAKERLQQQRLLQQQQFSTSNPVMPHVQPQDSQLPVKQQRPHLPQQYQQPPHQQPKLMKGGLGNGSVPQQRTLLNQKLVNQKQTTAQKLLLLSRKVNTVDQTTSKQAESSTAITVPNPPCNDANSSETETNVIPAESDPSEPPMNFVEQS